MGSSEFFQMPFQRLDLISEAGDFLCSLLGQLVPIEASLSPSSWCGFVPFHLEIFDLL